MWVIVARMSILISGVDPDRIESTAKDRNVVVTTWAPMMTNGAYPKAYGLLIYLLEILREHEVHTGMIYSHHQPMKVFPKIR